jgi:flagellar basal body-associated protein FliL
LFCVWVEALRQADPPAQDQETEKAGKGPTKGCRAIIIIIIVIIIVIIIIIIIITP